MDLTTADETVAALRSSRQSSLEMLKESPAVFASCYCTAKGPLKADRSCHGITWRPKGKVPARRAGACTRDLSVYTNEYHDDSGKARRKLTMLHKHHRCPMCVATDRALTRERTHKGSCHSHPAATFEAGELEGVRLHVVSADLGSAIRYDGYSMGLGPFSALTLINWVVEEHLQSSSVLCASEYIGGFVCGKSGYALREDAADGFCWTEAVAECPTFARTMVCQVVALARQLRSLSYTSDLGYVPLAPSRAPVEIDGAELEPSLVVTDFSAGAVDVETSAGVVRLARKSSLRLGSGTRCSGRLFDLKRWQWDFFLKERALTREMLHLEFYMLLVQVLSVKGACACRSERVWLERFTFALFGEQSTLFLERVRARQLDDPNVSVMPVLSGLILREDWESAIRTYL